MVTLKKILEDAEIKFASVCFGFMLFFVLLSVAFRLFGSGLVFWAEELARYMVVWGVCIGVAGVVKTRGHITIDFIVDRLPAKLSFGVKLASEIIGVCVYAFIFYYSCRFVGQTFQSGQLSPSLRWPMYAVYMVFPIGFGLSILRQLINMKQFVKDFKNQFKTADESVNAEKRWCKE